MKIDKDNLTNGNIKQPIGITILGGSAFFLILIIFNSLIPTVSGSYFCASSIISFLGFFSHIWIRVKPSLYARFFLNIGISGIFLLMAWRSLNYLFPDQAYIGIIGTTLLGVFSHTLPMWNSSLANVIREELFTPKTKIGKRIFIFSVAILVLVPVFTKSASKNSTTFFVFLFASLLMVILMPFTHRAPGSPWEHDITTNKDE